MIKRAWANLGVKALVMYLISFAVIGYILNGWAKQSGVYVGMSIPLDKYVLGGAGILVTLSIAVVTWAVWGSGVIEEEPKELDVA